MTDPCTETRGARSLRRAWRLLSHRLRPRTRLGECRCDSGEGSAWDSLPLRSSGPEPPARPTRAPRSCARWSRIYATKSRCCAGSSRCRTRPRPRRAPSRWSAPAPTASTCAPPTGPSTSASAATRSFDGRYFTEQDDSNTDTFIFRRVRPIVEGTLGNVVDFRIMPDFANSTLVLQDAYLNLKHFPLANLQAGKFKAPFGLERLQSATAMTFVERALPTQLVPEPRPRHDAARSVRRGPDSVAARADERRERRLQRRRRQRGRQGRSSRASSPSRSRTARREWLSGLGVGVAVDYGSQDGGTPSVYRTQGQATFFSYAAGTELDRRAASASRRRPTTTGGRSAPSAST